MIDNHGTHASPDHTTHAAHDGLGVAGNMAKAFIHSPLSPLLLFASLCLGLLGLVMTPRQEDPQISVPMIDIFVSYPGASSAQVSTLAIEPLERIMSEITGIKHVYSASMRGQGMVTIEFDVGQLMGPSIVKVHDKLQSNLNRIPPGVSMPLVKPKGVDDVPVVTLTLWSRDVDDSALRTLALDVLQGLKEVPDTGWNEVIGGRHSEIRVEVRPERLSGFGISLDQVAQTIRSANAEQSAGSSETGGTRYSVTTGAFLRGTEDIKRLVVGMRNSTPVYVGDVAHVFDGPQETTQMVAHYTGVGRTEGTLEADGAAAVTIAIAKKEGSNGVTVANALLDRLSSLRGHLIPSNVQVDVTRNYGETANEKVNDLLKKLFIATGAVTILVLFALGIRPSVVVTIVIPVVILLTVFGALMTGYSINRVSLFALIFSIGILVDDAIVVVENIYRRWLEKGESDTDTAVDAVREVGNPTILATFTVVAALLPMGFVSGMMGPYMRPIPVLGSIAMVFSLFAAFMFTPWLVMRIKPSLAALRRAEKREHREKEVIGRYYRAFMVPLIENRFLGWVTLFSIIAVWFLSVVMFYFSAVPVKMLPYDNKSEFDVIFDMPDGTALPNTANVARQMVDVLRKIPEVTALQSYVGTASPFNFNGLVRHYYLRDKSWHADIQLQLTAKKARHRKSHEIAVEARNLLEPIAKAAGATLTVAEVPPGPPVLQSIVAEVYGPDEQTRRRFATDLTGIFAKAALPTLGEMRVVDVDNYMTGPHDVYRFEVDTEKAVRRGISVDTINRNLAMAMGGEKLGDVKRGKSLEPTYITIQIPLAARAQIAHLGDLPIPSTSGTVMPLAELGRFVPVPEDNIVFHKDLRANEYVVGDLVGRLGAPIYGMFAIQELLNNYTSPDGIKGPKGSYIGPPKTSDKSGFEWTGEWTVTYETFRDMGIAFAVALVLIYILVVWEFGNFTLPAIIMAPIPLTLIGIVPGHWLMGAEFTATSMIGFIALAGIIVRNSILLVDFAKHQVLAGYSLRESVLLASETRMRPIMITAFALVAGSFVILFDPIFQGMAVSLLFGVLVSTVLTLVVIPLGCTSAANAFEYPHPPGTEPDGTIPSPPSPPSVPPKKAPVSSAPPRETPTTATPASDPATSAGEGVASAASASLPPSGGAATSIRGAVGEPVGGIPRPFLRPNLAALPSSSVGTMAPRAEAETTTGGTPIPNLVSSLDSTEVRPLPGENAPKVLFPVESPPSLLRPHIEVKPHSQGGEVPVSLTESEAPAPEVLVTPTSFPNLGYGTADSVPPPEPFARPNTLERTVLRPLVAVTERGGELDALPSSGTLPEPVSVVVVNEVIQSGLSSVRLPLPPLAASDDSPVSDESTSAPAMADAAPSMPNMERTIIAGRYKERNSTKRRGIRLKSTPPLIGS
ncbi:membrane hypothetical protein [Gammaproteobacteria bacterium]